MNLIPPNGYLYIYEIISCIRIICMRLMFHTLGKEGIGNKDCWENFIIGTIKVLEGYMCGFIN